MPDDEELINLRHDVDRHENDLDQQLRRIRELKGELDNLTLKHTTEIESLQEDVRTLTELVWRLVYKVTNERLERGVGSRHAEMAKSLADKHNVVDGGRLD